jgi:hypothetical protein
MSVRSLLIVQTSNIPSVNYNTDGFKTYTTDTIRLAYKIENDFVSALR